MFSVDSCRKGLAVNVKRTVRFALIAALLCLILAGCASPLGAARYARLYDDDGAIAQQADSYSVVNYRGPRLDDAESTLAGIHIGDLSGSMTLLSFNVPEEGGCLSIRCDAEAARGDIKLVFAAFDDQRVETLCEGEGSGSLMCSLDPGEYALKAVAVHGGADVAVQVRASDAVEAFLPDDMLGDSEPVELGPLEPLGV